VDRPSQNVEFRRRAPADIVEGPQHPMEDIMSTTSIAHSHVSYIAAAAAALAIGAGAVVISLSDDPGNTTAPAGHISQTSVQPTGPHHDFHYTTSGGRVMTGL
jgi:hypothetical protein